MAQVDWDVEKDIQAMLDSLVTPCAIVGAHGKAAMQDNTPVSSGILKASEHYAVVMPDGERVAGDVTDGNGNAAPVYAGNDMIQVIVGTNEAAEKGGNGYADGVNNGVKGRTGAHFGDAAIVEMEESAKREIG